MKVGRFESTMKTDIFVHVAQNYGQDLSESVDVRLSGQRVSEVGKRKMT